MAPSASNAPAAVRVAPQALKAFCRDVYARLGMAEDDAASAADVLVAADLRGIVTHGVWSLHRYVRYLRTGLICADARAEVLRETPTTLLLDGHHALGAATGVKAMRAVLRKAGKAGAAFASVRNSTHFGIAGYYAMMALEKGMIGIAMTNARPVGVPTFGAKGMFGTNPLAFAAPADREKAFVLDMATTVVTNAKIEIYGQRGKKLPRGWAIDASGRPARDAKRSFEGLCCLQGGIMPLGGAGEEFGGHKGYGLAVMVDILCAALSGGPTGAELVTDGPALSHFFGAISIAAFRDPAAFRADMDVMLRRLRKCPPAAAGQRVYFAGLKEFELEQQCARRGIPLNTATYDSIISIGRQLGVEPPRPERGR